MLVNLGKVAERVCLQSKGVNRLTVDGECTREDGRLWVYQPSSKQIHLAYDVSLCLDVFVAKNALGVYWCHGASRT